MGSGGRIARVEVSPRPLGLRNGVSTLLAAFDPAGDRVVDILERLVRRFAVRHAAREFRSPCRTTAVRTCCPSTTPRPAAAPAPRPACEAGSGCGCAGCRECGPGSGRGRSARRPGAARTPPSSASPLQIAPEIVQKLAGAGEPLLIIIPPLPSASSDQDTWKFSAVPGAISHLAPSVPVAATLHDIRIPSRNDISDPRHRSRPDARCPGTSDGKIYCGSGKAPLLYYECGLYYKSNK